MSILDPDFGDKLYKDNLAITAAMGYSRGMVAIEEKGQQEMSNAKVLDVDGKSHEVDEELYRDFLHDMVIAGNERNLDVYLSGLKPDIRDQLSEYIVWRLAAVDPGYVGDNGEQ